MPLPYAVTISGGEIRSRTLAYLTPRYWTTPLPLFPSKVAKDVLSVVVISGRVWWRGARKADVKDTDDSVSRYGRESVFIYLQNSHCSLYLAASLAGSYTLGDTLTSNRKGEHVQSAERRSDCIRCHIFPCSAREVSNCRPRTRPVSSSQLFHKNEAVSRCGHARSTLRQNARLRYLWGYRIKYLQLNSLQIRSSLTASSTLHVDLPDQLST
jgi:hypothetical protein